MQFQDPKLEVRTPIDYANYVNVSRTKPLNNVLFLNTNNILILNSRLNVLIKGKRPKRKKNES